MECQRRGFPAQPDLGPTPSLATQSAARRDTTFGAFPERRLDRPQCRLDLPQRVHHLEETARPPLGECSHCTLATPDQPQPQPACLGSFPGPVSHSGQSTSGQPTQQPRRPRAGTLVELRPQAFCLPLGDSCQDRDLTPTSSMRDPMAPKAAWGSSVRTQEGQQSQWGRRYWVSPRSSLSMVLW